ncbi:MAG: hypothetical protein K2Q34_00055 [Alphaproteobacteria bacterium]|nr:hypothetical protein [Alphaproteobacteria bacterium]
MKFIKTVILSTLLLTTSLQNLWAADDVNDEEVCWGSSWLRSLFPTREMQENALSINSNARDFLGKEVFEIVTDEKNPEIKTHTTLNTILTAHDELLALIQSSSSLSSGIHNTTAFPRDVFQALQQKERSLRVMINLIWGSFMIDNAHDRNVDLYITPRRTSFLFQGKGFENKQGLPYQASSYSFPDDGNSATHVAQIRYIAKAMGIDFDATLSLPFDPQKQEVAGSQSSFCILNILKLKEDSDDEENAVNGYESTSTTGFEESDDGGKEKMAKSIVTLSTSSSLDPAELKRIRDYIKFNLVMEKLKTDYPDSHHYSTKIVERIQGTQATVNKVPFSEKAENSAFPDENAQLTEEMLGHHTYLAVPFGSPLKPTTVSMYIQSQAPLRAYWERTEGILTSAEEIISSNPALSGVTHVEAFRSYELIDRVKQILASTLQVVHNHNLSGSITWSPLVTEMLKPTNLHVPVRTGTASYVGNIRDLTTLLPSDLQPSEENLATLYLMNATEAEVGMSALEVLVTEFKEKISA